MFTTEYLVLKIKQLAYIARFRDIEVNYDMLWSTDKILFRYILMILQYLKHI